MNAAVAAASIATPAIVIMAMRRAEGTLRTSRTLHEQAQSPVALAEAGVAKVCIVLICGTVATPLDSCLDVSARETTHDPILGFTPRFI